MHCEQNLHKRISYASDGNRSSHPTGPTPEKQELLGSSLPAASLTIFVRLLSTAPKMSTSLHRNN
eukprot:1661412-Amphidinium_carterae.1